MFACSRAENYVKDINELVSMLRVFKPDSYSLVARALPIFILILPGFLVVFLILPPALPADFSWKSDKTIITGTVYITCWIFGQVGGDWGKRRENDLWEKWGGAPTTRFLRHCNSEFNPKTRERVHKRIHHLGLKVPSKHYQEQNPQAADEYYESCVLELIRRTRDKNQFPLVFVALRDYGFRRNAYALKIPGLASAIISIVGCSMIFLYDWGVQPQPALAIKYGLFNFALALLWLFWVTEKAVKTTAERYARSLLEACLDLEVKDGDNSLSER